MGPKVPPLRHGVININLVHFFGVEVALSSLESSHGRVTSWRAQDRLIRDGEYKNNEYSEDIPEEVVRTEFSDTLIKAYSCPG